MLTCVHTTMVLQQAHKYGHTHRHTHTYPIEFVVESTWITDGISVLRPPPKDRLGCTAVGALVVHALQGRLLLREYTESILRFTESILRVYREYTEVY